jgi:transcriptional regulator with XRE-family HTH domain
MMAEMAFKDRLRALREAAGLTQEGLARKAGLSSSTVAKPERGPLDPHWGTALKLADALGVPLDAFKGADGPPAPEPPPAPKRRKKGGGA